MKTAPLPLGKLTFRYLFKSASIKGYINKLEANYVAASELASSAGLRFVDIECIKQRSCCHGVPVPIPTKTAFSATPSPNRSVPAVARSRR